MQHFRPFVIDAYLNRAGAVADVIGLELFVLHEVPEGAAGGDDMLAEENEREAARDVEIGSQVDTAGNDSLNDTAAFFKPFSEERDGRDWTIEPEGPRGDGNKDIGEIAQVRL